MFKLQVKIIPIEDIKFNSVIHHQSKSLVINFVSLVPKEYLYSRNLTSNDEFPSSQNNFCSLADHLKLNSQEYNNQKVPNNFSEKLIVLENIALLNKFAGNARFI